MRERMSLSPEEFALFAGLTTKQVKDYENGIKPRSIRIKRVWMFLDMMGDVEYELYFIESLVHMVRNHSSDYAFALALEVAFRFVDIRSYVT